MIFLGGWYFAVKVCLYGNRHTKIFRRINDTFELAWILLPGSMISQSLTGIQVKNSSVDSRSYPSMSQTLALWTTVNKKVGGQSPAKWVVLNSSENCRPLHYMIQVVLHAWTSVNWKELWTMFTIENCKLGILKCSDTHNIVQLTWKLFDLASG